MLYKAEANRITFRYGSYSFLNNNIRNGLTTFISKYRPLFRHFIKVDKGDLMDASFQHEDDHDGPSPLPRRPRLRIANACQACRGRKVKCDGVRPECSRCLERRKECVYKDEPLIVRQRTKRISTKGYEPSIGSHIIDRPSTSAQSVDPQLVEPLYPLNHVEDVHDLTPDDDHAYYTPYGQFAGDITAAVDDRAGLAPSPVITSLVPFVDAPLFGEIDWSHPDRGTESTTKLPPRAYADRLVGVYWQHVHPIESVLDKEQFLRDYEDVYNSRSTSVDGHNTIRLSIINIVFALAVQRQELIPIQKRDEEANSYFLHAWALLPLEKLLWEPGSLELVQCLMLMNRYLHCTNNRQRTWTTAGLAMRMAQSLRCYLAYDSSSEESSKDRKLKQQVWTSCVGLDR